MHGDGAHYRFIQRLSPGGLLAGFVVAACIGLAGGLGPAWRAAPLRPIEALRRGRYCV